MGVKCPKCHSDNTDTARFCSNCATPLPSSKEIPVTETIETPKEELTTGSTFAGRYQIIEELGIGGMGKVYKAQDTDLKEKVAIKLLKPGIAADKKTIERFRNELKFARKIRHKNVCQMYDLNKEEGTYYITMEYVSGEDLKSFIRRAGPLSAAKAIFIAKQVCEGLAEAHQLGVVHRDLKPQNIMIDKEGNSRIMDFGIARSIMGKGITGAGVMIGTPEYMSPEQAEVKEVDQRSDIYSMGVILYEMVTGRIPFEGETPLGIAMKQKSEMPKDPREFNAQIPEELSRVILTCLEKDKDNRYQSAGEVRSELDRIETGMPTTERIVPKRRPGTSREITVTFNLRKLFIPAFIVLAIVVVIFVILKLLPPKEILPVPSDKPSVAVMYFKNNTGEEKFDHWRSALSDLLIADLAQSRYLHVLSGDNLYNILRQMNLLEARSYSREEMERVASRGGVNHIIQGDLSKAGENFRINIVLQKADTGEILGSESVDGKGEASILSMVDELTRRIKRNFMLSAEEIASDIDRQVGKIATSSPEALNYYIQGREFHNKGEFRKSIQMMEKALAVDPEFAMAYRSMAMSYNNLLMFSETKKYLHKAFELKDRLSARESYLVEGEFYRNSELTFDKAIEAYTRDINLYPDDTIANTNLGILYTSTEQWDKAIERFDAMIQYKDKSFFPYVNIAEAYRAKGMYETVQKVLEEYIQNFQENDEIRRELALNFFLQEEYDLALAEVDKAFSLNPDSIRNHLIRGNVYFCAEDFEKAEEEYFKILDRKERGYHLYARIVLGTLNLLQGKLESGRQHYQQGLSLAETLGDNWWRVCFHIWMGHSHLRSGRPTDALKEYDLAWKIAPDSDDDLRWQRRALYYKGRAYLALHSFEDAQKAANGIKELVEKGTNKKEIRYFHHLLGLIELGKGNYSRAIAYFKEAISSLPYELGLGPFVSDQSVFAQPLALAYYRSGEREKAREEYEKILSLTMGMLYYGDIYARSLYWLGKINEEEGLKDKAKEYYQKFLDLWKEADPVLVEVEDAKKRLAGLKSR
jgi:serine/threonine protein kinase/Tfp pilus assembly protein PilF